MEEISSSQASISALSEDDGAIGLLGTGVFSLFTFLLPNNLIERLGFLPRLVGVVKGETGSAAIDAMAGVGTAAVGAGVAGVTGAAGTGACAFGVRAFFSPGFPKSFLKRGWPVIAHKIS
ncbi:unannotated protein [freshwater metagenome]|uniref:Unannotated protein n=1 Tax=freshwater metagenome TaxID=449393 RepID=A0A6J6GGB5_9ZZZZ